jgi:hypothetical protein
MPKTEIDYSNTIIYKITCKDPKVMDVYVGHTTNFVQRKHAHKQSCINDKTPNYKCKLYEVIRNNGGWVNWKMEIINFFECHDHYEARKKEQEYFISLNATLNTIEPMPKPKPKEIVIKPEVIKETFFCEKCNIHCSSLNLLETHNETNKHKKNLINPKTTVTPNNIFKHSCHKCDYYTNKTSSFTRHLLSTRHLSITNGDYESDDGYKNRAKQVIFKCDNCNKEYNSRNGIWKHKKTCTKIIDHHKNNNIELKIIDNKNEPDNEVVTDSSNNEIIKLLIKENSDFKSIIIDMMKSNTDMMKNNTDLQKQMLEVCQKLNK